MDEDVNDAPVVTVNGAVMDIDIFVFGEATAATEITIHALRDLHDNPRGHSGSGSCWDGKCLRGSKVVTG